jgi:hypothetical protein
MYGGVRAEMLRDPFSVIFVVAAGKNRTLDLVFIDSQPEGLHLCLMK